MKVLLRKFLDKMRQPFPFYFNNSRENLWMVLGMSVFIMLFLGLIQPRDYLMPGKEIQQIIWYGTITCFVLAFKILILPLLLPKIFDIAYWNLWKYVIFNISCLLMITFFVTIFDGITFCKICSSEQIWANIPLKIYRVSIVGVIPIFFVSFIIHNNFLKRNTRMAASTNANLKNQANSILNYLDDKLITIHSETKEEIQLNPNQFLFAESDDNYATLFWQEGTQIQNKLLRISLKNLHTQLEQDSIVRCHRSYLVNLKNVKSVSGNSNGFKLVFEEAEVPISRNMSKAVLSQISKVVAQ